jgi:hypothetical protein
VSFATAFQILKDTPPRCRFPISPNQQFRSAAAFDGSECRRAGSGRGILRRFAERLRITTEVPVRLAYDERD